MKLSICTIGDRSGNLTDMIPRLAALGYDGIELWEGHVREALMSSIYSDMNPDYETYRLGREWEALFETANANRAIPCTVPVVAGYFRFFTEGTHNIHPILLDDNMEKCRKMGILAKLLGGDKVRVMMDSIASADATPEIWSQLANGLKEMARAVQYLDVTLVLETHQGQLMDTTAATYKLLDKAGETNIKVNLDIHNLFAMGEDPLEALEALYPQVVHVHLKNVDTNGKPVFLQSGTMDYEPFLRRIQELGYDGFASVEWFGQDYWGMAAHELSWLRERMV